MARETGPFRQRNPWPLIAFSVCGGLTIGTALVGFLILPMAASEQLPVWQKICSAFGVKSVRSIQAVPSPVYASDVAWTYQEVSSASDGDAKNGTTLAKACSACHGERGVNATDWIPNLAGMRAEVVVKQLDDFKTGHRRWPVMNAIGAALSSNDIHDLAAYYASLRPAATVASLGAYRLREPQTDAAIEQLVFVGDPRRAVAPCASCHGLGGLKRAAPVLAGQQASYVERELASFKARYRTNDQGEQMRVIAARLTPAEMKGLARFLAIVTLSPGEE